MSSLRENRATKLHPNICQTFTVAVIMLEVCTFIDGDSFYDLHRMKINDHLISRALDLVEKNKYSKLLINLFRIMLSGCEDRPLPSQIHQTFRPY